MTAKQIVTPNKSCVSRRSVMASAISAGIAMGWLAERGRASEAETETIPNLFRVRSVVELKGEVRLKSQTNATTNGAGKQVAARTAAIQSTSTLDFDEEYQFSGSTVDCKSYQYFHEAASEITVDTHKTKTVLRDQCREIVKIGTASGIVTTCPDNPLFAAERDLVEGSINTMFLDQILTDKEVDIADKWTLDKQTTCQLFNLDAVLEGSLVVCLVDVDKEKAHLELTGNLSASVRQVGTQIRLKGKAIMDRKLSYISWFAANIEEVREISEAEPGFSVQAQVRILRAPIETMTTGISLTSALRRVPSIESASLLQFQSDQGFYRFLADRRWSTYRDNGEEATLRFIVDNRLIAQCNITNLVDFEPGRQLTLEGFQSEIKRLAENSGGEVLDGSEKLNGMSVRTLRIAATGPIEGVDIRWIHYHLSIDSGRRLSMVFTLNEEYQELFEDQDQQMIASFELLPWPKKLDSKSEDAQDSAASKPDSLRKPTGQATITQPGSIKTSQRPAKQPR